MIIPALSEIKDKAPVEAGEYELVISKAKLTKSQKTGRYGCMLIINIEGHNDADTIFHTLWYGNFDDGAGNSFNDDDDDKNENMWRRVKDFIRSIGLDPENETDESDLVGLEFTAEVGYNDGMGTDDDGNPIKLGQPRNEILRVL
ncbi:MAG TPA: DUF669 domain-containing protein [Candidatus Izemoplasmatales bacterium]|nr:DUF669 domain-containing protein [Candidatus Izemoplasmatales bacterium]